MTSYPEGTVGWLKYQHSNEWHRVEVLGRFPGTHVYNVRKSRTDFLVGARDVLIVVGGQ